MTIYRRTFLLANSEKTENFLFLQWGKDKNKHEQKIIIRFAHYSISESIRSDITIQKNEPK